MNIEDAKLKLEEKLDEMFPKGNCNERGAALVLFAEAILLMRELAPTPSLFERTLLDPSPRFKNWLKKAFEEFLKDEISKDKPHWKH